MRILRAIDNQILVFVANPINLWTKTGRIIYMMAKNDTHDYFAM